jgi:hypothetical protein
MGQNDMQENRDLYYIAALIDGEMNNSSGEGTLRQEIEKNSGLKFEYNVQSFIKALVSEKLKISPAPVKVIKRLKRKIISVCNGFK